MKNLRMMLACLAIGSGSALGCDVETSPEPDTTPQSPMAADQGDDSVPDGPELAIYWYRRGKELIKAAEAGDLGAYDKAKDALQRCVDKHLNMTECFRLLDTVNRPRPGCLTCGATAANVRAPNVPALSTLPQTP